MNPTAGNAKEEEGEEERKKERKVKKKIEKEERRWMEQKVVIVDRSLIWAEIFSSCSLPQWTDEQPCVSSRRQSGDYMQPRLFLDCINSGQQ